MVVTPSSEVCDTKEMYLAVTCALGTQRLQTTLVLWPQPPSPLAGLQGKMDQSTALVSLAPGQRDCVPLLSTTPQASSLRPRR